MTCVLFIESLKFNIHARKAVESEKLLAEFFFQVSAAPFGQDVGNYNGGSFVMKVGELIGVMAVTITSLGLWN